MDYTIPNQIKNAISEDKLIIFAGSGLSTRFNLPNWVKLVKDIIEILDDKRYKHFIPLLEANIMPAIDVLNIIKREHNLIHKYIKDNFILHNNDNLELHRKLINLSGKILTTNYDNAFERVDESIPSTTHSSAFNISDLKNLDNFIFKIHGCAKTPDSCILFEDDYKNIYKSETAVIEKLKSLFIDNTFLFIGFSFADPYVEELFSKLDNTFNNNNKHFIITSNPQDYVNIKYLNTIEVKDHTQIEQVIDKYIEYKNSLNTDSITNLKLDNTTDISNETTNTKIALLYPEPLEIRFDYNFNKLESYFENLSVDIYSGFLNIKTLQAIDSFDIVFIASKTFKGKIYVEDDNLKSMLLSAEEVLSYLVNDNITYILLTDYPVEVKTYLQLINICSYKSSVINRFIYKSLRNNQFDFDDNEIKIYNKIKLTKLLIKGVSNSFSVYRKDDNIDFSKKVLNNVVGRVEEQSLLANRIINLISSSKLLNVKGSGGIGKTTLIKKVTFELYKRGYFRNGVTFVSCENVKNYNDFHNVLVKGFNLQDIINFKEYLIDNRAKSNLLIILDNFETVTNITNQDELSQVFSLLEFATDYADIILTSRESLNLEFEDLFSLPQLITDDALKLFVRDYGEVKDVNELKVLRFEILENLLNNNPLAIKLVTRSRTRFKYIGELKDQLEANFFESTSEEFTFIYKNNADLNIERTKSIYQSINYSYSKLLDSQRLAFEILHLFPDGISLSNFKKCFTQKKSSNNISDHELRILRDKSLVEDDNGILQLQPIIRRFAEFQFSKRSSIVKQKYYSDAYAFNAFVSDIVDKIKIEKSLSSALVFFNHYKNNFLNVLDYIEHINVSEKSIVTKKEYFINYIYCINDYLVSESEINLFNKKVNQISDYFKELDGATTFLKVLNLKNTYYHKDFDNVYNVLCEILPPEDIQNRILTNESYIENRYKDIISIIHSMEGHTIDYLSYFVNNQSNDTLYYAHLYYIGIPFEEVPIENFYSFEYDLMFDRLNVEKLEKYITSLYSEEHLEIMQSTYVLAKVKTLSRDRINKLVVSNPYTYGLKELMLAFISNDETDKKTHFREALRHLYHIKYYYLEALYFYCIYLKSIDDTNYLDHLEEGIDKSNEYYYLYIYHKFNNLKTGKNEQYVVDYSKYPIPQFKLFMDQYFIDWKNVFKKEKIIS